MTRPWRIAIVGSGPSGMYAAGHLVEHPAGTWRAGELTRHDLGAVEVDVIDRLPTPWGLVRAGVAPDHPEKKGITDVFTTISRRRGVRFLGNVEVGTDITVAELSAAYDAVIHAHGAATGRSLPVPGAELAGSWTARDLVAWYNGHPDLAHAAPDLATGRAVVVGNGNVALDVARVLARPADDLHGTDIAPAALAALRTSAVREVLVLGRRGPEDAAFGGAELDELVALADAGVIDLVVEPSDLPRDEPADRAVARRLRVLDELSRRPRGADRRVVLAFGTRPVAVHGEAGHVVAVEVERGGERRRLDTGLVAAAIGYRSLPVDGLPFDDDRGVVPTTGGRVDGHPGTYATGWLRRGPSGMIGTNKACARDVVAALVSDAADGALPVEGTVSAGQVDAILAARTEVVGWAGWRRIDAEELRRGRDEGRPRVKITSAGDLVGLAAPMS